MLTCIFFLAEATLGQEITTKPSSDVEYVSTFYLQYDVISLDGIDLNGVEIGFTFTRPLSDDISHAFIDFGLGFQYAWGSKDSIHYEDYYDRYEYTIDYSMYSLTIPFNVGYCLNAGDDFTLNPYVGVNVRWYIEGRGEYDYDEDCEGAYLQDVIGDHLKLFDSDGADWKNFTFGWQIGLKATYRNVSLGLSYAKDFTKMVENGDNKTSTKITLGINF